MISPYGRDVQALATGELPVGFCGIPGNAAAVAVNITVVNATTNGEMTAYPATESRPIASAISYQVGLLSDWLVG